MESHVSCSHRCTSSGLNVMPQNRAQNRVGECYLEKRGSRKNFGKISKSRKRFWLVSKSCFFMVCFYFLESRKFSTKGLGLGFRTRISATRRVPDFTIRHPSECIQDRPINAKRAAGELMYSFELFSEE